MGQHVPHYAGKPAISQAATATIAGGQLVENTGNMSVGPAGAASTKVIGVAGYDAVSGASVAVFVDGVHDLTAAGAISAGDKVCAAANGTVQTIGANTFATKVGTALEAIANGATGRILLGL